MPVFMFYTNFLFPALRGSRAKSPESNPQEITEGADYNDFPEVAQTKYAVNAMVGVAGLDFHASRV